MLMGFVFFYQHARFANLVLFVYAKLFFGDAVYDIFLRLIHYYR